MSSDSRRLAELELLKNRKFTATGSITAGDNVSLLSDGTVSTTNTGNLANYLGIAAENIASGATGVIKLIADISNNHSSLTINEYYFIFDNQTYTKYKSDSGIVGRAISSTEIFLTNEIHGPAQEIGYADGHSESASEGLYFSGYDSSGFAVDETAKNSFSSTANSTTFGTVTTPCWNAECGSDGDDMIAVNGAPGSLAKTEKCSFTSTAQTVLHGDTIGDGYAMACGSNGIHTMICGGRSNNAAGVQNRAELMSFASANSAVENGTLTKIRYAHGGASDGDQMLILGGGSTGSALYFDTELKSFFSTATATGHGNIDKQRRNCTACSDRTNCFAMGGFDESDSIMKQFASSATAVGHGSIGTTRNDAAVISDGANILIVAGEMVGSQFHNVKKTFASNAAQTSHGSHTGFRAYLDGASGN